MNELRIKLLNMNLKLVIFGISTVIVVGIVAVLVTTSDPKDSLVELDTARGSTTEQVPTQEDGVASVVEFNKPKKSAHYESNTPAHGSTLAAPPINVVIDFNFDLAVPSAISVTKDGREYGQGETVIDSNKLSMRRGLAPEAPEGKYIVSYKACWPDRTCHDGSFEFAIDRTQASSYESLKGKSEITIRMSEIMFAPKNIVISPGTKVTWVNDEDIEHYVNTDSHPAHTYYPKQNSRSLAKGDTFTVTFEKPGVYPYHCSAHAQTMTGSIIVS